MGARRGGVRLPGARGIAQQSPARVQGLGQDARQRLEWGQRMGTAVDDLQRVAGQLQRVGAGIWWDRLKEWLSAALIGLGLIFAAALAYQWAKEPKIEQRLYGCTARWDAKTGKCKGDRSEEHTSELQSLMRLSYAVFCLKKKKTKTKHLHKKK